MKKAGIILSVIFIVLAVAVGGYFALQGLFTGTSPYVPLWKAPINYEYGFRMTFLDSWEGYSIVKQEWRGWIVDTGEQKYSGVELVFKNPKTTPQQVWQDIPIMVFTHDVWDLVVAEKVSVSAAPIGPAKIGENKNYVFATPPRWYGFTDAIGFQEAVEIVKTFRAF